MAIGAALFKGNCSGHGTGSGSSHHPGLGGGVLGGCPHSPTAGSINPKPVAQMDAVTTWKPTEQKPKTKLERSVIINNKIPIIDRDELVPHPTKTKHSTSSASNRCFTTRSSPAWHCTEGISGGREASEGHQRRCYSSTKTVWITGELAGRIGDDLGEDTTEWPCLSTISGGSEDVFIGD